LREDLPYIARLWERKRQAVEQAPGLTIWRGGETFADIGGCDNIKRSLAAVLTRQESPRVVVFVDEIEKSFGGTGTDTSGVKTEMTGAMFGWMQDRGADGIIAIGRCVRFRPSIRGRTTLAHQPRPDAIQNG